MFESKKFLLFTVFLANAVNPEIIIARDVQTCVDLCASCGGASSFEEQVCRCRIPGNDEKASECMKHVQKQQNEKLKLELLGDREISNRGTRCCPFKSKKQMRSTDVDRVIKYFVNGGPTRGIRMFGNAQEDCEKNGTTSRETSESPAASVVPEQSVERASDESGEGTVEPDTMSEVEIPTTLSSSEEIDEIDNLHEIEPRFFLRYHNRQLSSLPQVFIAIPQALATADVAPSNGGQYSFLSVSQLPNSFARPRYPYLLRAAPSLPYGLRSEEAIQIHVPVNNREHIDAVTQGQLINPYLEVPNALLAGPRTPFPYEFLLRAPQYDAAVKSFEPRFGDAWKMTDEKLTPAEAPKFEETPSPLHEVIAQQNLLLHALSERLHDYASALEASQSE